MTDGPMTDGPMTDGLAITFYAHACFRLQAAEVSVVEAYTVPFSLVLLGFGWWWWRTARGSSWAAFGVGLSSTMVPSLLAVYADTEWRRSLLLGTAALVLLLAGARYRLQAPTVIGGAVLAGVALRELGPYVSEMLTAVPRWVPIAVFGLLLVVVGATYEARKRDLRWLRDTLAPRYEELARQYLVDPWAAHDDYIEVILNRSADCLDAFLARHATRPLTPEEKTTVARLLELQRHGMLMYTSCGWFFNDGVSSGGAS